MTPSPDTRIAEKDCDDEYDPDSPESRLHEGVEHGNLALHPLKPRPSYRQAYREMRQVFDGAIRESLLTGPPESPIS